MRDTVPAPRIEILPAREDFEIAAANAISTAIARAIGERGDCLIALSGGSTPRRIYHHLGDLLRAESTDLSHVQLIFVDERMVPPDHADSNYGMIHRELIGRISIPASNVHRIKGEVEPGVAASDYESELGSVLPRFEGRCDLIILGVGEEGHTASLFPGSEALSERTRMARSVFVPKLETWRVTLTLPAINRARAVLFLAAGKEKAAIIEKLFSEKVNEEIPAKLVNPSSGTVEWILDSQAASRLPSERRSRFDTSTS